MILVLLLFSPVLLSIIAFASKGNGVAKNVSLVSAIISMVLAAIASTSFLNNETLDVAYNWLPSLGAQFSLHVSGMGALMVLLTNIVFLLIIISQYNKTVEQENRFYGLMLLAQVGLLGVFLANDLLLFYFFWELALIPVYFLCSQWGGEKRIKVTFKFFVYTFLGSLLMLGGILYLYIVNPTKSFDITNIISIGSQLSLLEQQWLFVAFFIAFAIKMPIFPFHTWQPDAYEQSSTPVTVVLSAVMVKMGLFATVKWVLPVLPLGVAYFADTVIILSLIGLVYASFLAMVQTDIKRLIAYSSIAHIALMNVGLFAQTDIAMNGLIIQMFNHGINITGLWLIVSFIENRYGTRNLKELGGMAGQAPKMAIALVIIAFANISLPLTNAFVGEFMLFHGIFMSALPCHITYMVIAGLGIILGAIYTLNMVQKVAYGTNKDKVIQDAQSNEWIALLIVIAFILVLGVYPSLFDGFLSV